MSWRSFEEFERELYAAGYGRDGLVIDVRYNGGGFTADHLLTALTQPAHAITVSRGGGPGYPQDRKVYASWSKPIVVLVNQDSFSNAEIFAHAIRTLRRGKLVGVTTAGGVISTGGRRILDLGWLRTPGRGWFVLGTGEDMEMNGAVPDYEIWPEPGDAAKGIDRQLDKAVLVLAADVEAWQRRPRPELRYRSQR
jgi:tricorn protease